MVSDLQRPAFGGLVVVMDLLGLVSGVSDFIIEFAGMCVLSPLQFIVYGLSGESQLPGNL